MGSLTLPAAGAVYLDAQAVIYTVEKHPTYLPRLLPLWQAVQAGRLTVVSSELTVLEVLVAPLRRGDARLADDYEQFFRLPGVSLLPVALPVLREAARLRATLPALRTPDSIHGASCLLHGCPSFVTNDQGFRRVPGLPVVMLDDVTP